jgi:hypothetical protein
MSCCRKLPAVGLWQVADCSTRAVLSSFDITVTGCSFSGDGSLLASASSDGTVRLGTSPAAGVTVRFASPRPWSESRGISPAPCSLPQEDPACTCSRTCRRDRRDGITTTVDGADPANDCLTNRARLLPPITLAGVKQEVDKILDQRLRV